MMTGVVRCQLEAEKQFAGNLGCLMSMLVIFGTHAGRKLPVSLGFHIFMHLSPSCGETSQCCGTCSASSGDVISHRCCCPDGRPCEEIHTYFYSIYFTPTPVNSSSSDFCNFLLPSKKGTYLSIPRNWAPIYVSTYDITTVLQYNQFTLQKTWADPKHSMAGKGGKDLEKPDE